MGAAEMFILIVVGLVVSAMAIRAFNTYRNTKAQFEAIVPAHLRKK